MINPFKALLAPFKRLLRTKPKGQPSPPSDPEIANGVVIYHSLRTVHLLFHVPNHASCALPIIIPPDEAIRPISDYQDFASKHAANLNPPLSLLHPIDAQAKGYSPLLPLPTTHTP